jgi:hypothetical protein
MELDMARRAYKQIEAEKKQLEQENILLNDGIRHAQAHLEQETKTITVRPVFANRLPLTSTFGFQEAMNQFKETISHQNHTMDSLQVGSFRKVKRTSSLSLLNRLTSDVYSASSTGMGCRFARLA